MSEQRSFKDDLIAEYERWMASLQKPWMPISMPYAKMAYLAGAFAALRLAERYHAVLWREIEGQLSSE